MNRLVILALLAAATAAPQDPPPATVETVLAFMESRCEGLLDASYSIESTFPEGVPMLSSAVDATVVRGTGTRLRFDLRPVDGETFHGLHSMMSGFRTTHVAYAKDALHVMSESPATPSLPVAQAAFRIRYDDPEFKQSDPFFLPGGYPGRFFLDEPTILYQLDPRFFFRLEENLAYEGRRTEKDRTFHVLASTLPGIDLSARSINGEWLLQRTRKEFWIDVSTGMILRVKWDVTMSSRGNAPDKATFVMDAIGSRKLTDTLVVPESVSCTFIDDWGNPRYGQGPTRHRITRFRSNTGPGPDAILSPREAGDVAADAWLLKSTEYEAAVKKNPVDPTALLNLILSKHLPGISTINRMPPPADDGTALIQLFQKLAELRPASDLPHVNLLRLYGKNQAAEADALVAQVEKGGRTSPQLVIAVAQRLNDRGQHDRALKLIEKAALPAGLHLRKAAVEKLAALAAGTDDDGFAAAILAEGAGGETVYDKVTFLRELDARLQQLPKEVLAGWSRARLDPLLEAAAAAHPRELFFPLAAFHLKSRVFNRHAVAAMTAILKTAPSDPAAANHVLNHLGRLFGDSYPLAPAPAPEPEEPGKEDGPERWTKETAGALCAALDGLTGDAAADPRIPLCAGRALDAAEDPAGAIARFEAAFAKCAAVKPGHPSAGDAGLVLCRIGFQKTSAPPEAWLDKCVEALIALAPDGEGIPSWILYDRTRNPILSVIHNAIAAKDWTKFYSVLARVSDRMLGSLWHIRQDLHGTAVKECAEAVARKVFQEGKDAAAFRKFASITTIYFADHSCIEALEKARDLAPADVETLVLLGEAASRRTQRDKAIQAYEAVLPLVKKTVKIGGAIHSVPSILVRIAGHHAERPDRPLARETLGRIDLKDAAVDANTASSMSNIYLKIDELDLAIGAALRSVELGSKLQYSLGSMYEKKADYYEAIRWYNRDVLPPRSGKMSRWERSIPEAAEGVTAGSEARRKLLGKLGPDFLIKRLLEQKFESLAAEDETSTREGFDRLSSDVMEEREAGVIALRKIGARAVPLLSELLKAADPEIQLRVRTLFLDLAEPR